MRGLSQKFRCRQPQPTHLMARLDISMNGFWGGRRKPLLTFTCLTPICTIQQEFNHHMLLRNHKNQKKRAYDQKVRDVEHSTFTPLVMSATGGLARQAVAFYKHLASLLSSKTNKSYSQTIRCRLSFALLRSAIQCIRGARSSHGLLSLPPKLIWPPQRRGSTLLSSRTCTQSKTITPFLYLILYFKNYMHALPL